MSTEFYFPSRTSRRWLRVGPLAGDLDRFAAQLKAQGYARLSAVSKLRLVSNLSRWLQHQDLGVEALDEPRIEAFLLTRGPRCVRRGEATADSGPTRSPNPAQADHRFRFNPITNSGRTRSPIPVPSRSLFRGGRNRSGRLV